jgi:hypothetical protein
MTATQETADAASPLGAGYGPDRAPMVAGVTEQGCCSGCHYRFDSVGTERSAAAVRLSGRNAGRHGLAGTAPLVPD